MNLLNVRNLSSSRASCGVPRSPESQQCSVRGSVLRDVSFDVVRGEIVLLSGDCNSGKTALLKALAGLVTEADGVSGLIEFAGLENGAVRRREFNRQDERTAQSKKNVAMLLSDPASQVLFSPVRRDLNAVLEEQGISEVERGRELAEVVELFGMHALLERDVHTLSSGELQQVALAGVVLRKPSVLLLDEPFIHLSPIACVRLAALLEMLARDLGMAVIVSDKEYLSAWQVCRRVLHLANGAPVFYGEKEGFLEKSYCPPFLRWRGAVAKMRSKGTWCNRVSGETAVEGSPGCKRPLLSMRGVSYAYASEQGKHPGSFAVNNVSFEVAEGDRIAIVGGNGAGKSTVLKLLRGILFPERGVVKIDTAQIPGGGIRGDGGNARCAKAIGPDNVFSYLGAESSVQLDLLLAQHFDGRPEVRRTLDNLLLALGGCDVSHARGREGNRMAGQLASQLDGRLSHLNERAEVAAELLDILALRCYCDVDLRLVERTVLRRVMLLVSVMRNAPVLLLDEPTIGLSHAMRMAFGRLLSACEWRRHFPEGVVSKTVVYTTHDMQFAADNASKVVLMSGGRVLGIGAPCDMLREGLFFSSPANQIFRDFADDVVSSSDAAMCLGMGHEGAQGWDVHGCDGGSHSGTGFLEVGGGR